MTKERNLTYDLLRVMACAMVVLMHSPLPAMGAPGPFLTAVSYVTSPCIGLFFMISGALLLPVQADYGTFLKRRFGRIVIPAVLWTVVYVVVAQLKILELASLPRIVLSIPFSAQGHGVLWFMYTLAGLYLLAPIISPWLERARKHELEILLGLWAITLCYPVLENFVVVNVDTTGVLYYFAGYAGYFALGFYLRRYPRAIPLKWSVVVSALGFLLLFVLKRSGVAFDYYRLFGYESIFVAAYVVMIWSLVSRMRMYELHLGGGRSTLMELSNLSFGIYLMHILLMHELLWQLECVRGINSYVVQTLVIFVLTFAVSALCTALLSRLPLLWWLVGYRKKTST